MHKEKGNKQKQHENEKQAEEEKDESTKKSERKRQREKQRRSDLTNAFDELAALMDRIDKKNKMDSSDDSREHKKGKQSGREGGDSATDTTGPSRLDLIGRTTELMERQHRENEELKQAVASLKESVERSQDQVIVVLPQLVPMGETRLATTYPAAAAQASDFRTQTGYSRDPFFGSRPTAFRSQGTHHWNGH